MTPDQLRRVFAVADWTVRSVAPLVLSHSGRAGDASTFKNLTAIVDRSTALAARDVAYQIGEVDCVVTCAAAYAAYSAQHASEDPVFSAECARLSCLYAAQALLGRNEGAEFLSALIIRLCELESA